MTNEQIQELLKLSYDSSILTGWFTSDPIVDKKEFYDYVISKLTSIIDRAVISIKIKDSRLSHHDKIYLNGIGSPPITTDDLDFWKEKGLYTFEHELSFIFIWGATFLGHSKVAYKPHGELTEEGCTRDWLYYIMEICLKAIRSAIDNEFMAQMHFHDILQVCLRIAEDEDIDLYKTVPLTALAWVNRKGAGTGAPPK